MLYIVVAAALAMLVANLALAAIVAGLRWRNERRARRWRHSERRWQPLILDLLAGTATPESLRVELTRAESRRFLAICSRFARRLTGPDRQLVCDLAGPSLAQLRSDLTSDRPAERARSLQMIGELGFPDHADAVVEAIEDPSPLVAMLAARTIARGGDAGHVEALVARLDRFGLWSPALLAAMLASIGPQVAPALRTELADPGTATPALVVAARALGLLRDAAAADIAAENLRRDAHPDALAAQLSLIEALGRTEHLGAVRAMTDHPDAAVRARAMAALGRVGAHRDRALARRRLHDPSPWVAVHAARALRRLGGDAELKELAGSGRAEAAVAAEALAVEA